MRYIQKQYRYNTKDKILKNIIISIILGSLLGSLFFIFTPSNNINKLDLFLDSFVTSLDTDETIDIVSFIEIFLKNIKYFVFIWFLGFIFLGEFFIYLIIFLKGFFISFTSSIFFYKYDFKHILLTTYTIENIFSIILIFYISYKAIDYYRKKQKNEIVSIRKYIKYLFICIIFNIILLIAFYWV